jgi:hypothetical protein
MDGTGQLLNTLFNCLLDVYHRIPWKSISRQAWNAEHSCEVQAVQKVLK